MHFNKAELYDLASHPSHDFNKEGVLSFLEKQDGFFRRSEVYVERWCRLRGNLLFYFKSKDHCSEPAGLIVLENFQIVEEESVDFPYSFTLVSQDKSHTLSAANAKERALWIGLMQRASLSYMKAQIDTLLHQFRISQQSPPVSIQKYRMDTGASIDLSHSPFVEMSLSCDNLRCGSDGSPPNPRVSVYISNPPHKTWILYAQTEIMERTSNPCFLSTVALRDCDGVDAETKVCFIVCDVRERVSDTAFHLGKTMIAVDSLLEGGRLRLFLLSPHKHTVGFITLNSWLVNSDSKELKAKHCHATPKHCPISVSPKPPAGHRRTQSLPPKLSCQSKQPGHGNVNLLYENPVVSTFRFHSGLGGDISVMEVMAEPIICFQFPQQLLRLWITEEQLHQEEVSALGDLTEEWRSRQVSLLNQHSTLINVYGVALSTLEANVRAGLYFKRSTEKDETSLEFCPLNLHLQRLFAHNESLRRSNFHDVLTVGAFSANSLGFKKGGLLDMLHHSKGPQSVPTSPCSPPTDGGGDKAVVCEDTIEALRRLRKEIILLLRLLLLSLQRREADSLLSIFGQLQLKTNSLLHILDPSLIDEAFEFLDQIRVPQNPCHPFTIASRDLPFNPIRGYTSPELALEMELSSPVIHDVFENTDGNQKVLEDYSSQKCQSYKYKLEEGLSEFCVNSCYKSTDEPEPWDLIQLNIRASLMCLSSKIKNLSEKFGAENNGAESQMMAEDRRNGNKKVVTGLVPVKSLNEDTLLEKSGENDDLATMLAASESKERSSVGLASSQDVSPSDDSGIVVDQRTTTTTSTSSTTTTIQNHNHQHSEPPEKKSSLDTETLTPKVIHVREKEADSPVTHQNTQPEHHQRSEENQEPEFVEINLSPDPTENKEPLNISPSPTTTQPIQPSPPPPPLQPHPTTVEWMSEVRPSIRKLRQAIDGLMRTARLTHSVFRLKEGQETSQFNHAVKYRRDICFSQALTTVVTGLLTKIWCRPLDTPFASLLTKMGPLVLFEGLLSCYGNEAGRLSDMIVAVEDVGTVDFVMVPAGVFTPAPKGHGGPSQQKVPFPRVTGTRRAMRVILPVPEQMLSLLPCSATKGHHHPADPPSFRVTPVFFNVGINEQATLAAKLCRDGAQYRSNHNNFDRLQSYYNRFRSLFPPEEDDRRNTLSSPLLGRRKESLNTVFSQLHAEIFLQQSKNVAILQTAAKICRAMDGVRVTSCKSAKDRTAMSVTLEEVGILKDEYDLSQSEFKTALGCLRSKGTRLANCEKNLGRPKYAFSSIQLALFPQQYKPPAGTFGALPT